MSHKYTRQEIDSAKITILQAKLGDKRMPADELYMQAINVLDGVPANHSYAGDPNEVKGKPEVEELDG